MLHHLMIGMPGEAREEHRLDGHVRCRRDEIVSIHQDTSEHLDRKEAQVKNVENFGRFKKCTCISHPFLVAFALPLSDWVVWLSTSPL